MALFDCLNREFGSDPDIDQVDAAVRSRMQAGLDELARQRKLPTSVEHPLEREVGEPVGHEVSSVMASFRAGASADCHRYYY